MKKYQLFLFFAIILNTSCGQNNELFKVKVFSITDKSEMKSVKDFHKIDSIFFEDNYYKVTKSCSGEWGGTIRFEDKSTGIEYECQSTCPVVVNKYNGKYIVTNTLAHLSGSSEILEIENPKNMIVVARKKEEENKDTIIFVSAEESECRSKVGSKTLIDSIGVMTLATFPYNSKLYNIVTDFEKTYITEILNNKFKNVQLLSDISIWTYGPEVVRTKDNHSIIFFSNEKANGYLDIFENRLKLYLYK